MGSGNDSILDMYLYETNTLLEQLDGILLAAEQRLAISEVAAIVRESGETVRRWVHRYEAEGLDGLSDAPRSGKPAKAGAAYRERLVELVRRRPRALDLPFSLWTAARLADRLAEETGLRMSVASIHRLLRAAGLGFGRPQHTISSPDPDYAVKKRRSNSLATG